MIPGMSIKSQCVLLCLWFGLISGNIWASHDNWKRQEVDWDVSGGSRIKAIRYPAGKPLSEFTHQYGHKPKIKKEKIDPQKQGLKSTKGLPELDSPLIATVIESPPIDGFVPWIAVAATDEHYPYDPFDDYFAWDLNQVTGNFLCENPSTDFAIGLFDTGASASILSFEAAAITGIYDSDYASLNTVEITGATGSIEAYLSYPLGIFIDGLGAIDPNGIMIDHSNMVGEGNVSVALGQIGDPNLPTAIGVPMSVYFTADIQNDNPVTVTHNDTVYTAPTINIYPHYDPQTPVYPNTIYLELRPSDVGYNMFFPCFEFLFPCPSGDGSPVTPTMIMDANIVHQGVFFVYSVHLHNDGYHATDKTKFMFDTGAQITVISGGVSSLLGLNPAEPDFEVDVQGVSGEISIEPGFFIDSVEIPAEGEWLIANNVPVVRLNVPSPEGGYFEGIIGMNLFSEVKFTFQGGGIIDHPSPEVRFEAPAYLTADIAPGEGDYKINDLDLNKFINAWLSTAGPPASANWDPDCDIAPADALDEQVNLLDFAVIAEYWLKGANP